MSRQPIPFEDWQIKPHHLWNNQNLLLSSGDFSLSHYNCMTVGWGSFGTMWNRPFALVVVRPQRYTYEFTEKYDSFTLTAFPQSFAAALNSLGTKSGRDGDKIAEVGLTPINASVVASPIFAEAELAVECKKIYWDELEPDHFLSSYIQLMYARRDYHRMYFGEIVAIAGELQYQG
ncbi:MAG: flavin reductase [Chloroflexi bacterium HGW-Chloroflexi-10]|nr:MAG: flavin reductase [Chloroflexi bacterium HGW-Chloroflexi-10]